MLCYFYRAWSVSTLRGFHDKKQNKKKQKKTILYDTFSASAGVTSIIAV